jgi:hypothetical protein
MLKIEPNLSVNIKVDQKVATPPPPASPKNAIKAGTVIVLTPNALKLSRELQAITSDPDKDPAARLDASEKLRELTAKIFDEA